MSSFDEDYASPERLAIYLEIGWSDYLFGTSRAAKSHRNLPYPDPLRDRVPPSFSRGAAELARLWATSISLDARSLCDVGGATGRTIFELERQFTAAERLVLIEPSKRFCEWARRLLSVDDELPEVPLVDRTGSPRWVVAKSRPPPLARANDRLAIVNETLERYEPQHGFDLITCLNVVDRHPSPSTVVNQIGEMMNDGGLLIMSCPFDFDESTTPDVGMWIDDLNALFNGTDSWNHVGEDEIFYEFRAHNRSWTRFSAQIVGKRWHAKSP